MHSGFDQARYCRRMLLSVSGVVFAMMAGLSVGRPLSAQNLQNITASSGRSFPGVVGVIAMREDDAGRYYILAAPGSSVLIFDVSGNQVGQIPNSRSGGATIRYGIDLDLTAAGDLVIADRGSNTIEQFGSDGSLVNRFTVFAPTSVVALPNGQFAITTLRTDHPVQIVDDQGRVVRGFGDPAKSDAASDTGPSPKTPTLADLGRVAGDAEGHLYFARISATAPEIRKYDRFGYIAYAVALPPPPSDPNSVQEDRVQFSFGFARLSRSDQETSYATIGDSGRMNFGAGVGMGLGAMLAGGGGGMRGGGFGPPAGAGAPGLGVTGDEFDLNNPGGPRMGRGGLAGTVTGDASIKDASVHLHLGVKANQRRARATAASANGSTANGAQPVNGNTWDDPNVTALQNGSSSYFNQSGDDSDSTDGSDAAALSFQSGDASSGSSDANAYIPSAQPDLGPGPLAGGSPGFLLGGIGPRPGFRRNFGGGFPGGPGRGGFGGGSRLPGAGGPGPGTGDFGPPHRFGASTFDFTGSVRINLDRRHSIVTVDRMITAIGVDRQNQEVWAAAGSLLTHFDKDGTPVDTYYLATPEGAPLHASAILVEPDRLVVASDTRGIYSFARPDKANARRPAPASSN
jgi:hypothetical protein